MPHHTGKKSIVKCFGPADCASCTRLYVPLGGGAADGDMGTF